MPLAGSPFTPVAVTGGGHMARTVRFALVLIAALGAMMAVAAENRGDLSGIYLCEGINPDGTPYKGLVEITATADAYQVRWTMSEQATNGIGIYSGGVLAVSYFGGTPGVVVYRRDGSRLVGEWTMGDSKGQLYSETLTKLPKQLRERLKREGPSALRSS
jgi:hypothetical protein